MPFKNISKSSDYFLISLNYWLENLVDSIFNMSRNKLLQFAKKKMAYYNYCYVPLIRVKIDRLKAHSKLS